MGVSPVSVWEAGARNEMEEDVAVTRTVCNRAGNEPSRTIRFHREKAPTRAFSWLKALTTTAFMRYYVR